MIDVENERMMSLREARDWLHATFGRRIAQSTAYHWADRGVRGRKLEVVRLGGSLYTSREAMARFLVNGKGPGVPEITSNRAADAASRRAKEVFG